MLSQDLPQALDSLGIESKPFGSLRHRYYEAVHQLASEGRKEEAIRLIELATGVAAFDKALQKKETRRKHHELIRKRNEIAALQLNELNYTSHSPLCYELLSQNDFPELKSVSSEIYDVSRSRIDSSLLRLGRIICSRCVLTDSCTASLAS